MTVIVGVDPGAKETGIAVVDWTFLTAGPPTLLASTTVVRVDDEPLIAPSRAYLHDVRAAVLGALVDYAGEGLGVEGLVRPKGQVRIIDPSALVATAQVLGAVLGSTYRHPVVSVAPARNGHLFPLHVYPAPIGTRGKGHDKRRHERSAYDVAVTASNELARILGGRK